MTESKMKKLLNEKIERNYSNYIKGVLELIWNYEDDYQIYTLDEGVNLC